MAWTSTGAIVPYGWNTVKIVANGSSVKYYINDTLLWSGTHTALTSGRLGFGMYRDSYGGILYIDWARFSNSTADINPFDEIEVEQSEGEEVGTTWTIP
jgi:hypothetical protein